MSETELMTIEEVAEWLRVSVASLRFWRYKGYGPKSARLGRGILYRRADVQVFVDAAFEAPINDDDSDDLEVPADSDGAA